MKRIKNAVWSGLWGICWVNKKGNCNNGGVNSIAEYTRKEAIERFNEISILKYKSYEGKLKAIRLYVRDRS